MEETVKSIESFIGKYSLTKTLRFSLIPQGKTQQWIDEKGVLEGDYVRAQKYGKVKEAIDAYHRDFIGRVLDDSSIDIDWMPLARAIQAYQSSANEDKVATKKDLEKVQGEKRKEIANLFSKGNFKHEYSQLFAPHELFARLLPAFAEGDEETLEALSAFDNFTVYFGGFQENRANMYSPEKQGTAIAYRIVNENFSRFYANVKLFRKAEESCPELLCLAEKEFDGIFTYEELMELFDIGCYGRYLSQSGIDRYNTALGGISEEFGNVKRKGLNELINLAFQKGVYGDSKRIRLASLYKQILSDAESLSFRFEAIEDDLMMAQAVADLHESLGSCPLPDGRNVNVLDEIVKLVTSVAGCDASIDLSGIVVKRGSLSNLSRTTGGHWDYVESALTRCADERIGPCKNLTKASARKWRECATFTLADINFCIQSIYGDDRALDIGELASAISEKRDAVKSAWNDLKPVLCHCKKGAQRLLSDEADADVVKRYLDGLHDCCVLFGVFEADEDEIKVDSFYESYDECFNRLRESIPVYNRVRNYITQKPYSTKKMKLMFDHPMLGEGWALKNETTNGAILLRDSGRYYLGIMDKEHHDECSDLKSPLSADDAMEKMEHNQVADPSKDLPNLMVIDGKTVRKVGKKETSGDHIGENLVLEAYKEKYLPAEINRIRKEGTYKADKLNRDDLTTYIAYYAQRIIEYKSDLTFDFKSPDEYASYADFCKDVKNQAMQLRFAEVSRRRIDELVENGYLYLFQIYCKDFSEKSTGSKNLHTLYFENLFSKENLKDVTLWIQGGTEFFYRPASIEKPVVHKKGDVIVNRTMVCRNDGVKSRKHIRDEVYVELCRFLNGQTDVISDEAQALLSSGRVEYRTAPHDIIKDKRFTKAQYYFHSPISINCQASGKSNINGDVLEYLYGNSEAQIIGVDRGERHLLYVTRIDMDGNILEQRSLNCINEVDYRAKLDQREKERMSARKSWKKGEGIADLKKGYLSAVVRVLADMMIDHNAILVMEDLNAGFKRSRLKVEKQVYQNFEKALIEKLNYCAAKPDKVPIDAPGGILRGYQLANKFDSFKSLGMQNGFIFYVSAWNTSHIDPTTGFANLFRLGGKNEMQAKELFLGMDEIRYNPDGGYFEFTFDYRNFDTTAVDATGTWTVCTCGTGRLVWDSILKQTVPIDVTERMRHLFDKHEIAYCDGEDLRGSIGEISVRRGFFKELLSLFRTTVQMRYSTGDSVDRRDDIILSPVKNRQGRFYCSVDADGSEPQDADANGAYNIALKGLLAIRRIEETAGGYSIPRYKKGEQNSSWLRFAQELHRH